MLVIQPVIQQTTQVPYSHIVGKYVNAEAEVVPEPKESKQDEPEAERYSNIYKIEYSNDSNDSAKLSFGNDSDGYVVKGYLTTDPNVSDGSGFIIHSEPGVNKGQYKGEFSITNNFTLISISNGYGKPQTKYTKIL